MRLVSYAAGGQPAAGLLFGDEIAPAGVSVRELLVQARAGVLALLLAAGALVLQLATA